MAMQPVVKPQETKPAPLPAYPVAPSSQTQTSSRGMVPPKHFAGGSAYAGVPKGIPHYAEGTAGVAQRYQPFQFNLSGASPVPAEMNVPTLPPSGSGFGTLAAPPMATAVPVTASTIMAAHQGALAHAILGPPPHPQSRMGTAILNANPASLGNPAGALVARGTGPSIPAGASDADMMKMMGPGEGVIPKGQPYPSTPQQVATAAANTGVNAATLQNAAAAVRDAQGNPGQAPNMAAAPHALANPQQYSSENFVNALRGVSFRHLAMVAQALRTAMPYNPQEQAYQQLLQQRTNVLQGMPHPKLNPEQQKAMGQIEQMEELRAGVYPYQRAYPTPQTDANGNQVDENGVPVQ